MPPDSTPQTERRSATARPTAPSRQARVPRRGARQGPAHPQPLRRAAARPGGSPTSPPRPACRCRPSTASCMTLTAEGYLDHLPNGDYRPGVRTLTLGTAALRSLDLVGIATPKLQRLGEATGETVNLAVLTGDRVLYLVRLRNSDLVTANIQVGSTLPAVTTSIGKLLLAHLDEADLRARITAGVVRRPARPQRQGLARRAARRAGPDPRAGLGHAGRGARLRPALGRRADHRRRRPGRRRRQPRGAGPGLVDPADRARAAARPCSTTCAEISAPARRRAASTDDRARRDWPSSPRPRSTTTSARSTTPSPAGRARRGRSCSGSSTTTGGLEGPFNAFLLQPRLGAGAAGASASAVRYETVADRPGPRDRHPGRRRALGLGVRVVRARGGRAARRPDRRRARRRSATGATTRLPTGRAAWSRDDHAAARTTGDLDDAAYAEAVEALGEAGLFELLTLVGYYATLALQLRVFRVAAPELTPA